MGFWISWIDPEIYPFLGGLVDFDKNFGSDEPPPPLLVLKSQMMFLALFSAGDRIDFKYQNIMAFGFFWSLRDYFLSVPAKYTVALSGVLYVFISSSSSGKY